jgi:hypothetical protein
MRKSTIRINASIRRLSDYKLIVLGEREFCSVTLANWLREKKVDFCLATKKECLDRPLSYQIQTAGIVRFGV